MSWIHKKPHVFNTTSWRCPPWQSRHCCHLPGTLAMTRRRVSCVTFTVFWRIAFLGQLMFFLWGYLKVQVFTYTLPDIDSLKNAICQEIAYVTQDTLRCVMTSVPGRWQQWLDCHGAHLQDVRLFVNPRHWLTWPCSVVFIAVYNKCVVLLSKWVMLNAAPCIHNIPFGPDSTLTISVCELC